MHSRHSGGVRQVTVRVGVIGLGTMGRHHVRILDDMDNVELVGVSDANPIALARVLQRRDYRGYSASDEMLTEQRPDLVVIAAPTSLHSEIAVSAMRAGAHVLIEKPIASTCAEARTIIDESKRLKRRVAVGHVERFNPAVVALKQRLADGQLGRVFRVHARRLGPFPDRIRDVGVVIDLATHDIDVARYLLGSEPTRIFAETAQHIHTDHEDMLSALLRFDDGVVVQLDVNWLTPTKIRELSVLGERGMFLCNYLTQELTLYRNADMRPDAEARRHPRAVTEGEAVSFPITQAEPLQLEMQSFIEAVRGEHPVEVDGEAGLRALHLAMSLVASADTSRVIGKAELQELWSGRSLGVSRGAHGDDL